MSSKNVAVFGIYPSEEAAEQTVDLLVAKGFPSSSISVLLPDADTSRAFAHEMSTKAPEGATTGATGGAFVGATFGLLASIGALVIPGVGPFIAAGPLMATLAGIGVGGGLGGVLGALVGMGIPEYEAKRFEGAVKDGGILLSVHCDRADQIEAAKESLALSGATHIASSSEETSADNIPLVPF